MQKHLHARLWGWSEMWEKNHRKSFILSKTVGSSSGYYTHSWRFCCIHTPWERSSIPGLSDATDLHTASFNSLYFWRNQCFFTRQGILVLYEVRWGEILVYFVYRGKVRRTSCWSAGRKRRDGNSCRVVLCCWTAAWQRGSGTLWLLRKKKRSADQTDRREQR